MSSRSSLRITFLTLALASAAGAQGVAPYGSTLTFGTGLVNIPVAWVSPTSGDLFVSSSARAVSEGSPVPRPRGSLWDLTESVEAHLGSSVSVGGSLYSTLYQQVGFFGQWLVIRQPESGARWLPSFAVGVRGLGMSEYQDRFVTGDQRAVNVLGDSGHFSGKGKINGNPTIYGVLTREFQFDGSSASFTAGYGNGLFHNDGNMDTVYNRSGTIVKGMFLGARWVKPVGSRGQLTLMAENDAWDWNAGAQLSWGHLAVGFYATELEERKVIPFNSPLANFTKLSLMLGYNASLVDIINGSEQRAEATRAQIELKRITQEIAQRRAHTTELNSKLSTASQRADAAAAAERALLIKQLDAEREALKKAAEALDRLQKAGKPPEGQR